MNCSKCGVFMYRDHIKGNSYLWYCEDCNLEFVGIVYPTDKEDNRIWYQETLEREVYNV